MLLHHFTRATGEGENNNRLQTLLARHCPAPGGTSFHYHRSQMGKINKINLARLLILLISDKEICLPSTLQRNVSLYSMLLTQPHMLREEVSYRKYELWLTEKPLKYCAWSTLQLVRHLMGASGDSFCSQLPWHDSEETFGAVKLGRDKSKVVHVFGRDLANPGLHHPPWCTQRINGFASL